MFRPELVDLDNCPGAKEAGDSTFTLFTDVVKARSQRGACGALDRRADRALLVGVPRAGVLDPGRAAHAQAAGRRARSDHRGRDERVRRDAEMRAAGLRHANDAIRVRRACYRAGMTDLQGKVALVTGANTGIGRVTAPSSPAGEPRFHGVSGEGAHRGRLIVRRETGDELQFIELDLGDLARRAAAEFLAREPLQLLINNAGVAGHAATPRRLRARVRHQPPRPLPAHAALAAASARRPAPARIVTVASKRPLQRQAASTSTPSRRTRDSHGAARVRGVQARQRAVQRRSSRAG